MLLKGRRQQAASQPQARTCCCGSSPAEACCSARAMALPRIEPRDSLEVMLLKLLARPGSPLKWLGSTCRHEDADSPSSSPHAAKMAQQVGPGVLDGCRAWLGGTAPFAVLGRS